jgi:hypothetical protein
MKIVATVRTMEQTKTVFSIKEWKNRMEYLLEDLLGVDTFRISLQ